MQQEPEVVAKTHFEIMGIVNIPRKLFSLSGRTGIWKEGMVAVSDSLILGYGFHADRLLINNHMHNAFLQSLIQTGILGSIAFMSALLLAWALFSLLATIAQWLLELRGLVSPDTMTLTSHFIAGGVLVLAGIYQFTPWKHACLEHCRSPLQFLTGRRRSGKSGALLMGLEHGTFCLGCCWVLMTLLLVGGIMNLYWIAGLTVFVVVEKLAKYGDKIAYVAGVLMAGTGTYLLISAG